MADRPGMKVGPKEHQVQHDMLTLGAKAPDFVLMDNAWQDKKLSDYAGMVKIISCVPSLDTSVCAAQTRRFNQEASHLSDKIVILTVSADLPPTQKRWCGAEGIDRVATLSCSRGMAFADAYGVHDIDWGICQRAVFVIDADDVVRHAEYVPVIGQEVDFVAALESAKKLV